MAADATNELFRIKQETENTGRDEPGIDQAGVVNESRHELHLTAASYLGRGTGRPA